MLTFRETKTLLLRYKIPFSPTEVAHSKKAAFNFAQKIGYPVALKIFSPEIFHRTEKKGVRIGIKNEEELKRAFSDLIKIKGLEGVLIQKMAFGKKVALGMKRDPQFGPVLMAGLGGIFIEVLKDVSFRVCPVSEREALNQLKELKGYPILKGLRGEKRVNIKEICKIISRLSELSLKEKNIKEIDLNPVIVNEKNALAVDAKFII
jgi:acetyl-CoA synthetase (ADP-forming)